MKVEITSFNSTFFEYLCGFIWFDQDKLETLMKRYPIGATEQGESIFWHINAENKITNGHIITMDSETGKVYGRTRQTLWRAVQMLTQKLCCQTIHDCPKVVPLHYESE